MLFEKRHGENIMKVVNLEEAFKGKEPVICPECHMMYYRDVSKTGRNCDFCNSSKIEVTTHEHAGQLAKEALGFGGEPKVRW
jgi:hypothetical protein